MVLEHNQSSWQAVRPMPAVSLINAVFLHVRKDKTICQNSIRMSQVTDLVPIENTNAFRSTQLPCSTVLRREVFHKKASENLCVRKAVAWKTNKNEIDPLYPPYAVFFTDFVPGRENPLKSNVRVASSLEKINILTDAWLAENTKVGWKHYCKSDSEQRLSLSLPASCSTGHDFRLDLFSS
jgi:hypothetical protein